MKPQILAFLQKKIDENQHNRSVESQYLAEAVTNGLVKMQGIHTSWISWIDYTNKFLTELKTEIEQMEEHD